KPNLLSCSPLSDGVYQSTKGNYSETDATIPYNIYGWTKLGGEEAVNLLTDFCIIRTRFFDPKSIKYDEYATDSYTSMIPVDELVRATATMLQSGFVGTINIGGERKSDYDNLKKYKPSIKPCKFEDIQGKVPFKLSKDASMDVSLWEKIQRRQG
ncbi:MAG: sugar nucleotide-binding protein, partial [Nanoarchaeota archaeon]